MVLRALCVLCATVLFSGCLENATTRRLLDSVQRLSDTLAEELDAIRKELGQQTGNGETSTETAPEIPSIDPDAVVHLTGSQPWGVRDLGEFGARRAARGRNDNIAGELRESLFSSDLLLMSEEGRTNKLHMRCYMITHRCYLEPGRRTAESQASARDAFAGLGYERKSGEIELVAKRHGVSLAQDKVEFRNLDPHGSLHIGVLGRTYPSQHPREVSYMTYGGWLNHSTFDVGIMTIEGGWFDLDVSPDSRTWGTVAISHGIRTRSNPVGDATWRGVMTGATWMRSSFPEPIQGDAEVVYSMAQESLSLTFSNIFNLSTEAEIVDMAWPVIPVREGIFSTRHFWPIQYVHGDAVSGSFYGPDHVEVGGTFYSASRKTLGAFGATQ